MEAPIGGSLDHLFLDHDGVPTLVEVKRSSDGRIRREVIGQMLDYAANAVVYLPVDRIRGWFEERCARDGVNGEAALADVLGPEGNVENFWTTCETNLLAGRIRLVFISDAIPRELQRIVEFLNGQMGPAEVLAIEVRQYKAERDGRTIRTLVPRLIGQTAKPPVPNLRTPWTEARLRTEMGERAPEEIVVLDRVLGWARERNLRIWWGSGQVEGSMYPMLQLPDGQRWTFALYTGHPGYVQLQFNLMAKAPPFIDPDRRRALAHRLNEIPGVAIPEDAIDRLPSFRTRLLVAPTSLTRFLAVFDEVLDAYRQTQVGAGDRPR